MTRHEVRHRHLSVDEAGARDAADAAAAMMATALAEDIAAGRAPAWATRSLHPHELRARVSFAAIDTAQQLASQAIARRLVEDRARMLELIAADLAPLAAGKDLADRLLAYQTAGLTQIPGAADLINATAAELRAALLAHADLAGSMAVAEAAAQGFAVTAAGLDATQLAQIDALAQRLALDSHLELIKALRLEALRLPPVDAPSLLQALNAHAATLSPAPLEELARTAVAQADGMGRAAAVATATPALIYASELLDGSTCGPCSLVDGREYPSLAAARVDYPNGTYWQCAGGLRCRGTLVFVWASEAPPSVPF